MIYYSYYQSQVGQIKIEANENKVIAIKLMYYQEKLEENSNRDNTRM